MHTKKVTFSSFFTGLQQFDLLELMKIYGSRLIDKAAEVSFLVKILKNANDFLINTHSFVIVTDLKSLRLLYVTPSVLQATGYTQEEFITGGIPQFIKNYCPADRVNGFEIFNKITSHQKEQELEEKDHYQYITTFRFLKKSGYYAFMQNRMMVVAHDDKNQPWVQISIVGNIESFTLDDKIHYSRLKFNKKTGKYDTEFSEEYIPEYLDLLNANDLKILKLLALGKDNEQIAGELGFTEHTIKDYRKRMLKKTWCENTAELLTFALRNGLVQ